MFYSTDVLTRRSGFGIYWLAATLGSKGRTSFKKLSKKELMDCNLVRACKNLAEPEEPLALRLSSNLLCGIARVYQQQYSIYQSDVSHFHTTLKKALSDMYQKGAQSAAINLQLAPHPAGGGGLNLEIDPLVAEFGWNLELDIGIDWSAIGLAGQGSASQLEELEEDDDEVSVKGSKQKASSRGKHVVRDKADITLQEAPIEEDYIVQKASGFYGQEEPLLNFGDGEGLLEGHSPEMDAILREAERASSANGSQARGRWGGAAPSSSGMGAGIDLGGEDLRFGEGGNDLDVWAGQDFGGGDEQETLSQKVQREHDEGAKRLEESFKNKPDSPVEWEELPPDVVMGDEPIGRKRKSPEAEVDNESATAAKPAAKRTKKKAVFDSVTETDLEHLQALRRTYPERMAAEREKAEKLKSDQAGARLAYELVFGVPARFAPGLAAFWKANVTDRMKPPNAALGSRRRQPATTPTKDNHEASRRGADPVEEGVTAAQQEEPHVDVWGDIGGGGEEQLHETGRNDEGLGGMQMEDFIFDDVEQGRAGSDARLTGSQRNSMMPWNVGPGTSDLGAGDFGGFGSSQPGTARISLTRGAEKRSRGGSQIPSQLGSGTPRAGSVAAFGEDLLLEDDQLLGDASSAHDPEFAIATLERESLNFLDFVKRQADIEPGDLFLSDLIPVASSNEAQAAQGLYHLLVLATKSLLKVTQSEAYGDITIKIP